MLAQLLARAGHVARLADDLHLAVALDDQAQTVTDDGVIVGDEHSYRFASGVGVQCPGPQQLGMLADQILQHLDQVLGRGLDARIQTRAEREIARHGHGRGDREHARQLERERLGGEGDPEASHGSGRDRGARPRATSTRAVPSKTRATYREAQR